MSNQDIILDIQRQLAEATDKIDELTKKLDDREADLIEAKREEREKVINYLDQANDTRDLDKRLQALRGDKGERNE